MQIEMPITDRALTTQQLLEERFRRGISLLTELSESGVPIAVEGPKDVAALRRLGLAGPIVKLGRHSILTLADELTQYDKLLVLFDFDERGEELARQLTEELQGHGIAILGEMRRKLRRAFCWKARVVEGLKLSEDNRKAAKL
jgi:5S rRNA maturation endonuclease (ribonuclease M5)